MSSHSRADISLELPASYAADCDIAQQDDWLDFIATYEARSLSFTGITGTSPTRFDSSINSSVGNACEISDSSYVPLPGNTGLDSHYALALQERLQGSASEDFNRRRDVPGWEQGFSNGSLEGSSIEVLGETLSTTTNEPLLNDLPRLRDNCPEEARFIIQARWQNRNEKNMWDKISRQFQKRFNKKRDKGALQMHYKRARMKYLHWSSDDVRIFQCICKTSHFLHQRR